MIVRVNDNGIGRSEERNKEVMDRIQGKTPDSEVGFGLYNVNERIKLKFGEEYGIVITSKYEEGTTSEVILPKEEI